MSANSIRPQSPLVILRRIYLDITHNHCAAKLIEYFRHWREWKVKHHRTDWVYMPLKQIYEDLMREHSLHVIRRAIALLEDKGFLKRRNNPGNGQDKTYQYQLQTEVLNQELDVARRECEPEVPECENELSENTVEQQPQNLTTDSTSSNFRSTEQTEKPEWKKPIIRKTAIQEVNPPTLEQMVKLQQAKDRGEIHDIHLSSDGVTKIIGLDRFTQVPWWVFLQVVL